MKQLLVLLTFLAPLAGCSRGVAPKPNIILLVIDTLRADHLQGYGYHRPTTPAIDKFVEGGVRFDAAIAPSSWSPPSHTTIITGVYPYHHKVMDFNQEIGKGIEPLAVHLKRAGYSTGLFSTHLALYRRVLGFNKGLDHHVVKKNTEDPVVLKAAVKWAKTVKEPYFMHIILMAPHAPYNKYPSDYDQRFFTDMPPGGEKTYPFSDDNWIGEGSIPKSVRLGDLNRVGDYINRYDRSIRWTDDLVQSFWGQMDKAGRLDNTLLVITSDHGEGFGDHDCFAHELYLYDFLLRVPLVFYYPGQIPGGQVWTEQVPLADIVPTLLGFAGAPLEPEKLDGMDLSEHMMDDSRPEDPRRVVASYRCRGYDRYMVRSDLYKLIFDAIHQRAEFYHLHADPLEKDNLLAEPDKGFPRKAYGEMYDDFQTLLDRHKGISADRVSVPLHDMDPEVYEELNELGYIGK